MLVSNKTISFYRCFLYVGKTKTQYMRRNSIILVSYVIANRYND